MDNNQPVTVTQQPAPPVEPTQVPIVPPEKKSNKKLLMLLGIVLALILLFAVLYLAMGKKMTSVVPSPTPVPTTAQQPTLAVSPTSANPIIELTLVKGKTVAIPNSDITIVYKGQSAANPKCVDCSTTTDVVLTKLKDEQKLSYVCGGIAGTCTEKLSGFGYEVSLGKITEESATVKVQKQ